MAAVTRRQYKGAAAQTTITNALASGDTSATLAATTGWPSGTEPFFVVISPGTASEEKCSATISGSVLTLTRAQDDTTAQSHASGATIYPVFTADDADEANKFASTMTTRGDLVTMDSGPDFARLAVGAKGAVLVTDGSDPKWQAVGSNGTVLMADSGQTNGVAWSEQSLGYRNVIINGAMQVAQRGTSTASITSVGYYTADRWYTNLTTLGTWTQSVENDGPTGSGFRKSLKMLCTTADASPAAGDALFFQNRIEGQNVQQFFKGTSSAKQFTVSFWVKSNVTGTFIVEVADADNSRQTSKSYTVDVADTWEKKTVVFAADTTGAFDNDNAFSLALNFHLGAGTNYTSGTLQTTWASIVTANRAVGQTNLAAATNNYWQITGVQLEAGAVATPFEFEDYGTTLAKCQRYYCKISGSYLGSGLAYSTTGTTILVKFPTTMRVAPTAVETSGTASSFLQVLSNTGTQVCNVVPFFQRANAESAEIAATSASTGLTQGNATFILAATGAVYVAFSAEL